MSEIVALASTRKDTGDFVHLARSKKGRVYRKQILKMDSDFVHPANPLKKVHVDKTFAETLVRNFKDGICDTVQVPIADDNNMHVEDPLRNCGEVIGLSYDDKGVYADIDARKHADEFGKTFLGASALMSLDYADTATGTKKGPTLLHVAVTNRPYITNLGEYEEIIAASTGGLKGGADTSGEKPVVLIPADHEPEEKMELSEALTFLKDEHGIDVEALQAKAAQPDNGELLTALSNVIKDATGTKEPENKEMTVKDVAAAVIELAEDRVALSAQVETLTAANESAAQREAEAEVDSLIKQGRVLPKQRDVMVTLSRTNREAFDALVPEDSIVSLSASGVDTFDAPEQTEKFKQDIERLAAIANGK